MNDPAEISRLLNDPFDPRELKFKPGVVKDNRCLAMVYVDARVIQDRLDHVFGVDGWSDKYTILPDGQVMCELSCRFGDDWVSKSDVGGQSEQPDGGDRLKAAFSDALKRAAVKFGVGRYLYRLPGQWVDYDPQRRQVKGVPKLPTWALPARMQDDAARMLNRGAPPAQAPKAIEAAPAKAPAGTEETPDRKWQRLVDLNTRFAAMVEMPAMQLLDQLFEHCRIPSGATPQDITEQQWQCLFTTVHGAIKKRVESQASQQPTGDAQE